MIRIRSLSAAAVLTASLSAVSSAQTVPSARAQLPIETQKTAYLECERAALNARLAAGEIMLCSVIYEEVKQRAFGGDFGRLKAWADERLRTPSLADRTERGR